MNEREILIILDQNDQTRNIAEFSTEENSVKIRFNKGSKTYSYSLNKIIVKERPIHRIVQNQIVLKDGLPIHNVQEVVVFEELTKVFMENEQSMLVDTAAISFAENKESYQQWTSLLNYWKEIAQHTKADPGREAFLNKQFSKLNFINKESVLATYMSGSSIDQMKNESGRVIYPFRFNLSQKQALEQALENNICIIEGPPGTGKTQTILNILANLIIQNKTVAVVSGNNAAVQNVKEKLQKHGYGFVVASMGNSQNRKSFFGNLPEYQEVMDWEIDEADAVVQVIGEVTQKLNTLLDLANQKAILEQQIAAYRLEQKHFKHHNRNHQYGEIERLFYRSNTPETIVSFLVDESYIGNGLRGIAQRAKLIFKYGFTDFKKLKEDRLELITQMQTKYYETKLQQLEKRKNDIQHVLHMESFEDLLKLHETNSAILFKHELYQRYKNKQKFVGDEKTYKNNFDEFLDQFPVMLSTTHSLLSCIPEGFLFDYVIIDESSQVDLLTGVLALSCCKHAIIVGDTKQLPQIIDQSIESKLQPHQVKKNYNYFEHSLLTSVVEMYGQNLPRSLLKEHYRCHPKIIGFCNSQYYNNELIPFTPEADSDIPIRVHYTVKGNHYRRVTIKGSEGSFNQREIEVVKKEIIKELHLDGLFSEDIGFTSPYRLQVEEAELALQDGIEIDTVHKYQGREKPIIIMSTVLDQTRDGQIGKKFVENSALVNVAVSRAQNQFILVTDYALFRNSRKDIGNLIRYIEYNSMHEHVTHSELISVFDLLYSEYSERLNDLQNRLVIKSKYKSENIMWRVLSDILSEEVYKGITFCRQVYLKDVFKNTEHMTDEQKKYIRNRASFDFVIYDALNKQPFFAIEVDGFAYHRNNRDQIRRDMLKNDICENYPFPLVRLKTTGSDEITKIRTQLNQMLIP
ncbi:AAA domain-containing protein [Paenibacillus sp. ALJ109b]|uniref:AAA domain-containing protein n=1 Tax=Paenibacillus sp. ALJ109b TaxID=2709068 RepID=UPI0013D0A325|nr:AAA domain-containing protein [Paenibacillus sp. ALJ109b]NEU59695.1 AAA family ATPase [Paenibacillus sp. ALJ109b]